MEPTEKEVEDRLRELGVRLASPPSDVEELLFLLDQTEIYLSWVEQSPSTSMSDSLRPAMNSLITKEFLCHPVVDVKVFVAACINEVIRVTAPDAPYNDALMKEIFAMIVDGFEKLDDMSGCLYSKRVYILEIMANVRSCLVMLDLECDDLILCMFKHFLKTIRPEHPINVFFSMETIMTLILEESQDISQELLSCLLSNVQNSKKGVIPEARRLAEKVISNCSMKLKPYFLVAGQSMGTYLRDYSGIVASICQDTSVAEQDKVDYNKLSERTVSAELPQESEKLDNPIMVPSNGVMPLGNRNAVIEPILPELEPENSFQCRNDVALRSENNTLGSITEKPGNELNFQYVETKSSSVQLTDASDSSRVDGDKEASASTSRRVGRKRQTKSVKSDDASGMAPEAKVFLESKREAELHPLEGLVGDNTCVNSADPAYNSPESGLPIRRDNNIQFGEKKSTSHKPSPFAGKKKLSGYTTVEKEAPPTMVSEHKDHCLFSISDVKPSKDSAKMSLADNATAEVTAAGITVRKSLREEQNDVASVVDDAKVFENQWKSNNNQSKAKDVVGKDVSAEPCLKEMMFSSKASIEANNVQTHLVKFPGGSLIKKGKKKALQKYNIDLEVIGREIEVWWPDDKMFYKGVIDAFDPVTGKHRVVYNDGDVESLLLRNERWNSVDYKNFERGQETDIASPESSLQVPRKERRASSGRRKSGRRARGKMGRKSNHMPPIQQSGDGNSREIASEIGPSLNEKTPENLVMEETKFKEPKPSEVAALIKDNEGTEFGLNGESMCKPRGEEPSISIESSQIGNSDDASAFKHGPVMDVDEKLKRGDAVKFDGSGGEDSKARRRKRKGGGKSLTASDSDISAINNLDGVSEKFAAKTSKKFHPPRVRSASELIWLLPVRRIRGAVGDVYRDFK